MKKKCLTVLGMLLCFFGLDAQDWPREISSSQGKLIIYQPQPHTLEGNKTTGIAAFSITPNGQRDPVFGALFYEAALNIDRDSREYSLDKLTIPNIKFSKEQKDIDLDKIKADVIEAVPSWGISKSLDQLITSVEEFTDQVSKGSEQFKNDAPRIIYTDKPSMLIFIDGEPRLKDIDQSSLQYVQNCAYVIFKDKSNGRFFLYGGEIWYTSSSIMGNWTTTKSIPKDITRLMEENKKKLEKVETVEVKATDKPPAIIVVTEPSELIQTNGAPNYVPVTGSSNLLYAKNSEDNLFKEISSNNFYILKSGRWYASQSLNGPWVFTPSEKIPEDFNLIQSGQEKDIVRSSVPGTDEARDAILDAQLPQTATIDRKTGGKDLKVEYDGAPQFNQIQGTSLQLAENANKTVMKAGSKYYCVDNGAWYVSNNYNGPWTVSDERPADVENIPASSSAYNTKYVYVYDSTPDVVYVGYTPGYMGSYVYGPTVVYGTGWYYRPWYGSWYYPHHCTWGFNMNYNPWTGWGFGFGFSTGPFHFGFGTGGFSFGFNFGWGYPGYGYPGWGWGGGMFGPPMYRPPCFRPGYPWYGYNRPGYNRPGNGGNINWGGGNQINIGGDVNINVNRPGNSRPSIGGANNLYARDKMAGNKAVSTGIANANPGKINPQGNRPSTQPGTSGAGTRPSSRPATSDKSRLPNDVIADRDGNVYKRDKDGSYLQNSGGNQWTRPSTKPGDQGGMQTGPQTRPSQPESRPAQPQTRPTQPQTRPTQPQTRPSYPQTRPGSPSGYSRPATVPNADYNRNRGANRSGSYNTRPASRPASRPAARPASGRR